VPHDEVMAAVEDMVVWILRNDRRAVESAKETIFEVIGRTLDVQLKVECLFGYALCGGSPAIVQRSQEFFDKNDPGRVGTKATPPARLLATSFEFEISRHTVALEGVFRRSGVRFCWRIGRLWAGTTNFALVAPKKRQ
jgi:hypothetical protein